MHHCLAEDALVNQSGGNISGVRVSLFCHYDLDVKGDRDCSYNIKKPGWSSLESSVLLQ